MPYGPSTGPAYAAPIRSPFKRLSPAHGFVPIDIPQSEANALIAFFQATDGPNWTTNTGWGTDPVVGNWHGVTVEDGHVTGLDLSSDGLSGDVGSTLLPLAYLTVVDFSDSPSLTIEAEDVPCTNSLESSDDFYLYDVDGTLLLSA